MALQWMDDFSSYGTGSSSIARMLNGPYAEATSVGCAVDPDPSGSGENVLEVQPSPFYDGQGYRKVLSSAQTTIGVACRQWLTAIPDGSSQWPKFASFRSQENRPHIYISVDPSGYMYAVRTDNSAETILGSSTGPVVIANAWTHYEVKVVLSATVGSIEVRKEGVTVLSISGVRTVNNQSGTTASCSSVSTYNSGSSGFGPTMYLKDYIIWDGSGTSNNDFFGSCQVYKIIPTSDVSLGWTPSSGTTGYNLIDEATPDDDSSYISAPFPIPSPSTFNMSDLPTDVTSVRGVMSMHRSRKTDGGDGDVQVSLISGSTATGANRTITTAYSYWTDMFDLAPDGGSWTLSKVNALELKLDRTL